MTFLKYFQFSDCIPEINAIKQDKTELQGNEKNFNFKFLSRIAAWYALRTEDKYFFSFKIEFRYMFVFFILVGFTVLL